MAFKFKFEALQKHRKTLRELAQKDFAEAEANVAAQMQLIDRLYKQIDEANEKSLAIRESDAVIIDELKAIEEFIELQKIKIENEREKARELLSIMEEKQDVLIEKARDYKMVELLRAKELERYKERLRIAEAKEIDDINLMRYSRS